MVENRDPIEKNGALVSNFDYSVDNFVASMDLIRELCGLPSDESFDASEIERFSSMITFLKEWKYFSYEPKTINFVCDIDNGQLKDDFDGISLPQFSSATVPKMEKSPDEARCLDSDFVLHAGGLVWAMDWCPRNLENCDTSFKCEYLAVSAHPPDSIYHKIGVPLFGRGIIQIWCVLIMEENLEISPLNQRRPIKNSRREPKGSYKNQQCSSMKDSNSKSSMEKESAYGSKGKEELTFQRPRGRPKGSCKKRPHSSVNDLNGESESPLPLSVHLGGTSFGMPLLGASSDKVETLVPKRRGKPSKKRTPSLDECIAAHENIVALPVSAYMNKNLEPSQPRRRGRPKKTLPSSTNELVPVFAVGHGKYEIGPPALIGSENLSGSTESLPVTHDLNGKLDTSTVECDSMGQLELSAPKRRRRPTKNLNVSVDKCVQKSGVEFGENLSVLHTSIANENPVASSVLVDVNGKDVSLAPIPGDSMGQLESSAPKRRRRPKKNLNVSVDKCVQKSGVELGENLSVLRTSIANENPAVSSVVVDVNGKDVSLAPIHSGELIPIPSVAHCTPIPAFEFGECSSSMLISGGVDASCGKVLPGCREQPRKQQILSTNKCIPASVAELVEKSSVLPTSGELGPSIDTMERCQRDKEFLAESYECLYSGSIGIEKSTSTCIQKQETKVGNRRVVADDNSVGQTLPFINGNGLTNTTMSENCINIVPMTNAADSGISMETREGISDCHVGMMHGSNTCRKKRRIKGKTTALSHLKKSDSQLLTGEEHNELTITLAPTNEEYCQGEMVLSKDMTHAKFHIPKDIALPKVVLCLAHMGKVAWDVKWRPASVNDSEGICRLGYLAALLGNGSLQVWEVPLTNMVKILHASCSSDGTDPRFVKLEPIFRCSKVLCGDRQSIPLTLEWSPSAPHDLILAGCHDGTVAIWKFSKQQHSQDIKPLLCFSADSVPIRSLAWAPDESDVESANLVVTAGHEGLKLWDIRDPYRPLWEYNPVQRIILSLEWLKDPRCLIMSFDDGTLRILGLRNVANDVMVTGVGAMKQTGLHSYGLHSYRCSEFAIWSVQVSRATGLAVYCTADGATQYFQLTAKAVKKDAHRNCAPHFLCGSFISNDNRFKIKTPLPKVQLPNIPWKKVSNEMGDAPLSSFISAAYQSRERNDQTTPPMKSKKNIKNQEEEPEQKLPPKVVAVHKVRWNMNKGCERWLCYGGAAGIVRCQKIS